MSALQLWLQNHNRKLTQDAIDEALMEYITHVEKQRDELLAALRRSYIELFYCNQQLTGVLDEDGDPLYRTGKTVSDSLEESKSLLESIDRVQGSQE